MIEFIITNDKAQSIRIKRLLMAALLWFAIFCMILTNLNQAAGLVNTFKQVAVDQSSEQKRSFNVKTYLNQLLFSLRPRFKQVHHTIHLECDDDIVIDSYQGVFRRLSPIW